MSETLDPEAAVEDIPLHNVEVFDVDHLDSVLKLIRRDFCARKASKIAGFRIQTFEIGRKEEESPA